MNLIHTAASANQTMLSKAQSTHSKPAFGLQSISTDCTLKTTLQQKALQTSALNNLQTDQQPQSLDWPLKTLQHQSHSRISPGAALQNVPPVGRNQSQQTGNSINPVCITTNGQTAWHLPCQKTKVLFQSNNTKPDSWSCWKHNKISVLLYGRPSLNQATSSTSQSGMKKTEDIYLQMS